MTLLSIVVFAVMILVVGVCVLIGLKAGFFKGLLNLVLTLLSVVLAVVVARGVSVALVPMALSMLESHVSTLAEAMKVLQHSVIVLEHFVAAMIAPILYIFIFIAIKLILMIPGKLLKPVVGLIPFFGGKALNRTLGAVAGALGGILIAVSLLCPITSYAKLTDESFDYVKEHGRELPAQLEPLEVLVGDHLAEDVVGVLGGNMLFSNLTTFDAEGVKTNLIDESHVLCALIVEASSLAEDSLLPLDSVTVSHLHAALEMMSESGMCPVVFAEIISELSQSWLEHESFLGILEAPAMNNDNVHELFHSLLNVLATTDCDCVQCDLDTLIDLLAHLTDPTYGLLEATEDPIAFMDALCKDGMISGMIQILSDNERMKPLIPEITTLGVHAAMDAMSLTGADMEKQLMSLLEGKDPSSYEEIVKSLSSTAKVLQHTSSGSATADEKVESIVGMLSNMGADGGEAVKMLCKPEQMESIGITGEAAGSASDMMSTMVDSINNAKDSGMSEEQYQEEAKAIGDMLQMVTSSGGEGKSVFATDGSDGKSAQDVVQGVLDSQIMSDTVKNSDATFEDALSQEDKAALEEAINSFNPDEVDADTLASLAAMFGITIP